jgi:hypothetical protein
MTGEANERRCARLSHVDATTAAALVDEAAKRSGLIWVRASGSPEPARPLWHVWQDGVAYVLTGGIEQPMPAGLDVPGAQAEITLRSKDKGSRLVTVEAAVSRVGAGSPDWDALVPALTAKRLNSPDGEQAPVRWARECVLLRLTPTGEYVETPDDRSTGSHAAPPPATNATTPVPAPWQLFGRRRAQRREQRRRQRREDLRRS